jgi:hypothetical protein
LAPLRASKTLDLLRVRAALRAADGDVVVAARALRMAPREILKVLTWTSPSGVHPRTVVDDADRPAWTDDDDPFGETGGDTGDAGE